MTSIKPRVLAGAFLYASILSPASAQTPAQAPAGSAVIPEIVVTATRNETPINQVGSAITVVRREEVARANPASLVDVLRTVPGLDISETGGPGAVTSVRLRGANSGQTLVLIDGQRVNDPSGPSGEFNFGSLAPGLIERIEVLRGPQSALYGSDAIGGVINIITKKGNGPTQVTLEAQGGSYGTASGGGTISGSKDGFSYAFSAFGTRSDGFSRYGFRIPRLAAQFPRLESDGYDRVGGSARVGYDTGWGLSFDSSLHFTTTRSNYDAAFGSFPDTPSTGRQTLINGFVRANYETMDKRFAQSVTFFVADTTRRDSSITYARSPFTLPNTNRSDTGAVGRRIGVEYQATARLDAFGTVVLGGRTENESLITDSQTILPVPGPFRVTARSSQATNAVFGLWTLPIGDRLTISAGGRIDQIVNGPQFATWRTTAAYQIPETGTTLRASAGTGGKAPTLFQRFDPTFGNPNLQSETSIGWDAGIDQRFFGDKGLLSLTYFNNRFKNLIDFVSVGILGSYFNVSRARTEGVELASSLEIIAKVLTFRATYTHLDARDASTNLILARRPRDTGRNASLLILILSGLAVSALAGAGTALALNLAPN
ncbi:MAG: TonB-dependent receptor, partial [Alphaproteobacteria bacterium]